MLKLLIIFIFVMGFIQAQTPTILHEHTVEIHYRDANGTLKKGTIGRDSDLRCREVPFDGSTFWSGEYAKAEVLEYCKKSFITTAGQLSAMKIHSDIETFGELEVLEFIEEMQEDETMLFVDSRKTEWYESGTIPTAINIPFIYFTQKGKWEKEKQSAMKQLGVIVKKEGGYDFSNAKTVLFFCNGVWCRQSPQMIEALLAMGFPPQKMKWYRGGMQSWLNVGMTSTRTIDTTK